MAQFGILKLKVPEGTNLSELEEELIKRGYEVEITGVFLQLFPKMEVPKQFIPKK